MRTIIPVVLRLLTDPAHPRALRGTLQTLDEPKQLPFKDERELLMLLRRVASSPDADPSRSIEEDDASSSGGTT